MANEEQLKRQDVKAWNARRFSNPRRFAIPHGLIALIARLALLGVLLVSSARRSPAQEALKIINASMEYDVMIHVQDCEPDSENGPSLRRGEVSLFRKGAATAFRILRLPGSGSTRTKLHTLPG
jgi:hypothetical protein